MTAKEATESWVVETGRCLPERKASWRRNQPPSEAQMRLARSMHIVGYADMTKARLSDEISVGFASKVLDGNLS